MPKILAPGFDLIRSFTSGMHKVTKRVPKRVRRKIRKTRRGESLPEDSANGRGGRPVARLNANGVELPTVAASHLGAGEEGVVESKEVHFPQFLCPLDNDLVQILPEAEEIGE